MPTITPMPPYSHSLVRFPFNNVFAYYINNSCNLITVFDKITEQPAYWIGNLMADGNIYIGKAGNPRIALTVVQRDREHLVEFGKFLNSTYEILLKNTKVNGKAWTQYTLRVSSKRLAEKLIACGVTP